MVLAKFGHFGQLDKTQKPIKIYWIRGVDWVGCWGDEVEWVCQATVVESS